MKTFSAFLESSTPTGIRYDNNDVMQQAFQAGYTATKYSNPYRSGQQVGYAWDDGFVQHSAELKVIPQDAPRYLQGRIAYKLGYEILDKPEDEPAWGRWVSGWLTEKDRRRS